MLAVVTSKERLAAIITLHQNCPTCKEITANNIAPEKNHQELRGERFNCSEEVFWTSQSVQEVAGLSPHESSMKSCHHQCRACSILVAGASE